MMNNHKEREAFEEVFPCSTGTVLNEYGHYESQVYQQDAMIQNISWVVWRAAKAQAVPEGYVLMPIKPTSRMRTLARDFDARLSLTKYEQLHNIWVKQAMIEALAGANA